MAEPAVHTHADPEHWPLQPRLRARSVLLVVLVLLVLALSAHRTQMDRMAMQIAQAIGVTFGMPGESQVIAGLQRIGSGIWPPQVSLTEDVSRIENFDPRKLPRNLPWGAHLESRTRTEQVLDPQTLQMTAVQHTQQVLVQPFGYLWQVVALMLQTVEIALWGTLLACVIAVPLALSGVRHLSPHPLPYRISRSLSSLLRAIPELISALFLVLAFGFGPVAGVLALGLHSAGFLGKFFAEDIENAPRAPQDALRATGAGSLPVLVWAVLPQVLPSYLGYLQYILERNLRSATVIGVVGAGGIGQELRGRFEMFDFAHVGTLLLVIFVTVLLLETMTGRLRQRWL